MSWAVALVEKMAISAAAITTIFFILPPNKPTAIQKPLFPNSLPSFYMSIYQHDPCQEAKKEPGSFKARPRAGGKFLASLAAVWEIM
jgi:hypothetical protein